MTTTAAPAPTAGRHHSTAPEPVIADAEPGNVVEMPALGEITVVAIERPNGPALRARVRVEYTADWMAFGSLVVHVLADTPVRFVTPA